jgi:hypothetical protein
VFLAAACSNDERPPLSGAPRGDISSAVPGDACARPNAGCACETPGESVECGELQVRSGDYATCSIGVRLCGDEGRWGECVGNQTVTKAVSSASSRGSRVQAYAAPGACSPADYCDPLCQAFVDSGNDVDSLGGGLCVVAGGLGICTSCGYAGRHASGNIAALPEPFRRLPESCTDDDDCGYDRRCVDDRCQAWAYPCHDASGEACATADLIAGPPCASTDSYHLQVCNRGSAAADSGTVRIGLYSDPARIGDCADPGYTPPDSGVLELELGGTADRTIQPGGCIEVNADNSMVTAPLDLQAARGVFVGFDAATTDCHRCNNWNVFDPAAACASCTSLGCDQDCAATSLTGTIRDPAGVTPIPSAMVYVPSGELAAFSDKAACDTCESTFSGAPIASTLTAPDGTFTLTNLPSGVEFPLVIQIGRFRRQVTAGPIERCGTAELSSDLARLPRTQRRCVGSTCSGEGDLPKLALVLADADPLQCLLRKMGIAESEFTTSAGDGRVHLFNHNGMRVPGGRNAFFDPDPLFSDAADVDRYNMVIAPCDSRHEYTSSLTRSGPTLNSHPTPTALPDQREVIRDYLDRGGRLFTSHWLGVDFVHLNYVPPDTDMFYTSLDHPTLTSQSGWTYADPVTYNPDAPVVHQFGDNVDRSGNGFETFDQHNSRPGPPPPHFVYTIDQSTAPGELFSSWAAAAGASPDGPGTITFDSWSLIARAVRAPAVRLAHGDSRKPPIARREDPCITPCPNVEWASEHASIFHFDTPWNQPPANQCGRLTVAEAHAAEHPTCQIDLDRDGCNSGLTPPDCSCLQLPGDAATPAERAAAWNAACGPLEPLTPAEKVFEYLLLNTGQCLGPVTAPPPPSDTLPKATFVRDYDPNCKPGTHVAWRHFSWKAVVPDGTSITFFAQTAEAKADVAAAPTVAIGTANETATDWTSDPETVDTLLGRFDTALTSRRYLRVTMKFNPAGPISPTLSQWRQAFDCVADE